MLGVSGAKSFSGFMVAAPGASSEPRDSSARGCLGRAGGQGSLQLRVASGAGSWTAPPRARLPRSAAARRLGTQAWTPPPLPPPASSHRTAHATGSRQAPAGLKGQRPCYSDHMTPQQLPPSVSRTHPSRHASGLATPRKTPPPFCPPLPESDLLSGPCTP